MYQHNNKNNVNIADELNLISEQLKKLDADDLSNSIASVHTAHLEIELVARKNDLKTLLAVVHCIDLNTELNSENKEQIKELLNSDSYTNWIDVFVSMLKSYDDNQRPLLHKALTSPNWIVKPSMILLKDIALWIVNIKKQSEETVLVIDQESNNVSIEDKINIDTIDLDKQIDSDISDDTETVNSSDEHHENSHIVTSEVENKEKSTIDVLDDHSDLETNDLDINEDVKTAVEESDDIISEEIDNIDTDTISEETVISSESNDDSITATDESISIKEYPVNDTSDIEDELFTKNNALITSLLATSVAASSIIDTDESSTDFETEVESIISNIDKESETALNQEESEVLNSDDVEIHAEAEIDSTATSEISIDEGVDKSTIESDVMTSEEPENTPAVEAELDQDDEVETQSSGLKMTWDDDTHPELLMVYLEETPNQVEELLPLLNKMANDESDEKERITAARLAHTIKGGSAVVGITALADLSSHLEVILEHSFNSRLKENVLAKLPEVGECIDTTLNNVQLQLDEPKEFNELFAMLSQYSSEIENGSVDIQEYAETPIVDSVINSITETATENVIINDEQEEAIEVSEKVISEKSDFKLTWDDDTHPELLMVYLEEVPTQIAELVPLLNKISQNDADEEEKHVASRMAHTIKGGSAIVGITALSELSYRLETLLDHSIKHQLPNEILEALPKTATCLENMFEAIQMQDEEPAEFYPIFKQLDLYVETIDDNDDEPLELANVVLPDFILNQNMDSANLNDDAINDLDIEETEEITDEIESDEAHSSEENVEFAEIAETEAEEHSVNNDNELEEISTEEVTSEIEAELMTSEADVVEKDSLEEDPTLAIETDVNKLKFEIIENEELVLETEQSTSEIETIEVEDNATEEVIEASEIAEVEELPVINENDLEEVLAEEDSTETEAEVITSETDSVEIEASEEDSTQTIDTDELNSEILEDEEIVLEAEQITSEIETIETNDTEEVLEVSEIDDSNNSETLTSEVEESTDYTNEAEVLETENTDVDSDKEDEAAELEVTSQLESESEENLDVIEEDTSEVEDINSSYSEPEALDGVKLNKLRSKEDVNNIIAELDDIVLKLINNRSSRDDVADYAEKCSTELQRFELITDISGYPELSLLGQWCQSNLESYSDSKDEAFNSFIESNEIWSWIEHVSEALRESEDMSHMSSLSVELMREDWLQAIKMEDLQTVLLALRHLEDTGSLDTSEFTTESNDDNEVISWDKDVHPELLAVYFQETPDQIDHVASLLHKISRGESTTDENKEAARIAHTIKGSSGVVGLNSLLELTHHLEDILDYSVNNDISEETGDLLSEASDCLESLFETIQAKKAPPEELNSVIARLSTFSGELSQTSSNAPYIETDFDLSKYDEEDTQSNDVNNITAAKPSIEKTVAPQVELNEAYIRVPIKVIDKLLNLAGELVTTSSQVSDNLAKTQETNKTIKLQDERVHNMLLELNNTITQQETDQQTLLSSIDNSDFDSLEMDTYNELQSVASLLSESILDSQEIDNTLSKQLNDLSEKLHSLEKLNKTFSDVILSSRMVTIDTIVPRLERIVRQTCRKTNKKAQLVVTGNEINIDTDILNNLVDPLLHMLRNSIDHGIETPEVRQGKNKDKTGLIELSFNRDGNNILMSLKDDGAGINPEKIYQKAIEKELILPDQEFTDNDAIRLILQPGFTTQEKITDISGRGVGMDVVNTSIKDLNGSMDIDSKLEEGTTFSLTIPLTLITNTTLLVKVQDNTLAIPTDIIEQILYLESNSLIERDNNFYVTFAEKELQIRSLGQLLGWPHQMIDVKKSYNILIINANNEFHAIHIDSIVSSREVVVKQLNPWISPARGVIGACHLTDGGVAPVINLKTVISYSLNNASNVTLTTITKPEVKKKILVVDDSLSNRKALSLIIEKTEYDVISAVDGLDALQIMNKNEIDLVFTDLEMPRMNGLELTQSIRAWNDKTETPVVMITSRTTTKHRELAKKAGVDDYLTKPVETETLLESINTWLTSKEAVEV